MGYSTEFTGSVTVTPPLNAHEIAYLMEFADSRRHQRPEGPYSVKDYGYGQLPGNDINERPEGQPSHWCNWEPVQEGTGIGWNRAEKFYDGDIWMRYLIDHFLKAGAAVQGVPGFEEFTFDHVVNGEIAAQGDAEEDQWTLAVRDNVVTKEYGEGEAVAKTPDVNAAEWVAALTTPLTDEQLEAIEQTLHDRLGPNWTQDYVEGDSEEPAYYRVATAQGTVVATVPDWAGSMALFLVEAHDYVPKLLGEIRRLRAQVAEIADLHSSMGGDCGYCADEDGGAHRWPCPTAVRAGTTV